MEKRVGSGAYSGEISALLEIYKGRYTFDVRLSVPGTHATERGEFRASGPEIFGLVAIVSSEEGAVSTDGRSIAFDGDQTPRIEGLDCIGLDDGRRHTTLSLSDQPSEPRHIPAGSSQPLGTLPPVPGGSGFAATDIPVGPRPQAVAVNSTTGRVYVANSGADTVSVIDGHARRLVGTIAVGFAPGGVAVNPTTNRIYVLNRNDGTVLVIDGESDRLLTTVAVGGRPSAVAVNPVTDRVYVVNNDQGTLRVIDGATHEVIATVTVGRAPVGVAVNTVNARVYVANYGDGTMSVIDGTTHSRLITVRVGSQGGGTNNVAVNTATERVYVTDNIRLGVWMIDAGGTTHRVIGLVPLPRKPWGLAVSETTNRVYVANSTDGHVFAIDGNSGQVTTIRTGPAATHFISVDTATERIYVPTSDRNTLTILR